MSGAMAYRPGTYEGEQYCTPDHTAVDPACADCWTRETLIGLGMAMADRQDWSGRDWYPPINTRALRDLGGLRTTMLRDNRAGGPAEYTLCATADGAWHCEVPNGHYGEHGESAGGSIRATAPGHGALPRDEQPNGVLGDGE